MDAKARAREKRRERDRLRTLEGKLCARITADKNVINTLTEEELGVLKCTKEELHAKFETHTQSHLVDHIRRNGDLSSSTVPTSIAEPARNLDGSTSGGGGVEDCHQSVCGGTAGGQAHTTNISSEGRSGNRLPEEGGSKNRDDREDEGNCAPFKRWRDLFATLTDEGKESLSGDRVWEVAREEGLRNGRLLAERRLNGVEGDFIRMQVREAERELGGTEGFWVGKGLDFAGLEGTEADFSGLEAGVHALFAIFLRRTACDLAVREKSRTKEGVVFGEHDLSEEDCVGGLNWTPLNIRICSFGLYLVDSTVRTGDAVGSDELEVSHIIFNSALDLKEDLTNERRYQSADLVRKSSPDHYYASYVLASYLQTIVESQMSCMDESDLVVGAPKLLFSHEHLIDQIVHRDYTDNLYIVLLHGICRIGVDIVSLFLMGNLMRPTLTLSETSKGFYDYGGAEFGILGRRGDSEITADAYRQFGVLRGKKKRKTTDLRTIRKNLVKSRKPGQDVPPQDLFMRRYRSSFSRNRIGDSEFLISCSELPHHGLASPDHVQKNKIIDTIRGTPLARELKVRFCKEWPKYVNDNIWRLWPRYHINIDKATNHNEDPLRGRKEKRVCVGEKTKQTRTFIWDQLDDQFVKLYVDDNRPE